MAADWNMAIAYERQKKKKKLQAYATDIPALHERKYSVWRRIGTWHERQKKTLQPYATNISALHERKFGTRESMWCGGGVGHGNHIVVLV